MQRTLFPLFILLTLLTKLYGEGFSVSGHIRDALTGDPVSGCEITGASAGTISDSTGFYDLELDSEDLVSIHHIGYLSQSYPASRLPETILLDPATIRGESVSVTGSLRTKSLLDSDGGVTLISKRSLDNTSEPHFQGLIDKVPNLNWAGGSSRPRYFQIRGMGERSQFAGDGPPNFSVGFSMDDVDLSGMGMSGMIFDVDRVELFRGPQSSIYGPNAVAGYIFLRSTDPASQRKGFATVTLGSAGTLNLGTALNLLTGPVLKARLAVYRGFNNGFQYNEYLNSHSTNQRQELMARLKLIWSPRPQLRFKGTLFAVDMDNGYDAWSPENEGFITHSDKPGKDSQALNAMSVRTEYDLSPGSRFTSITALSRSDMVNSYDSDWGNDEYWAAPPYGFDPAVEGWRYDFFDHVSRLRTTWTQELRVAHNPEDLPLNLVAGIFLKDLREDDDAQGYLFGGDESSLESEFHLQNASLYAQAEYACGPNTIFTLNFRSGLRTTSYEDDKSTSFSIQDQLNGGKLSILHKLSERQSVFVNLARGFKAGGINQHPRILEAHRPFSPEYVNNLEWGYRGVSQKGLLSVVFFYAQRIDQQVSLSSQQDATDPNSFTYYIGNAAGGQAHGLEVEWVRWLTTRTRMNAALGYLESHTDPYSFQVAPGQSVSLGDRAFAHAPRYSYQIGLSHDLSSRLNVSASLSGKDAFYFSESHDERSSPYTLGSIRGRFEISEKMEFSLWIENLTDTRYATRGYYFGLEPPAYTDKLYLTYGDPRHVGVTMRYTF